MRPNVGGITIDGPTSRDLDDAIWLDGDAVLVSIADVASAVPRDGIPDREARRRAFTRYHQNGTDPMLPRRLSEGACSLFEGEPRDTLTTKIELGPDLEIRSIEVERTRLRSLRRFDYAGVDRVISGAEPSPHAAMIRRAWDLSRSLLARRRERGALALYDLNQGWRTTEEGQVVEIRAGQRHMANILVQEFMILANVAMARWLAERDAATLYRNHRATPGSPLRDSFLATVEAALSGDDRRLIASLRESQHRILRRATYGPENAGHAGLNLPAYCHSTSPIRRYADLVVQRGVIAILGGADPPYSIEELSKIGDGIKLAEDDIKDQRKAFERDKAYRQAEGHAMNGAVLDQLDAEDFHRVIKVACHESRISEAVAASTLRRLGDGSLPTDSMRWLLLGFVDHPDSSPEEGDRVERIHAAILGRLRRDPHLAASIVSAAQVDYGYSDPIYTDGASGPDHQRTFTASLRITVAGREIVTNPIAARSKREARHRACVNLIALLVGQPEPISPLASGRPGPDPIRPNTPVPGNPIGRLNERSQSLRMPPPEYSFNSEGASHCPRITCTVRAFGAVASADASSKQEAKQRAAANLWDAIRMSG